MKLTVDSKEKLVYEGQSKPWGIFIQVCGIIILVVSYVLWRFGEIGGAIFAGILGLFLLIIGFNLLFHVRQLVFDFTERTVHYYRRSRTRTIEDCKVGFDQIKSLVFLTWTGSARAGGTSYHGKILFREQVLKLAKQDELEILQYNDKLVVGKELRRIAERGGFEVIAEHRGKPPQDAQ